MLKTEMSFHENKKYNGKSAQLEAEFLALLNQEIKVLYGQLVKYVAKQIGITTAQDILHDAVIVLILKAQDGKLRNKLAIKPFLYSTVRWLIRTYRLKNNRYATSEQENWEENLIDENHVNVDSVIENTELERDVFVYINKLSQRRDKQLLLLHYWYEKPEAFMEQYQVDSNHYYRMLYRAKQRLEKVIPKNI